MSDFNVYRITLSAKKVNDQDTLYSAAGPRLTAAYGLLTRLGFNNSGSAPQAKLESFVYIHRHKRMLGEFSQSTDKKYRPTFFSAQQKRGTFAIDKSDYSTKGIYPGNISIQPVIESDLEITLLARYDAPLSENQIKNQLRVARFSGGMIESFEVSSHEGFDEAVEGLSGFAFQIQPEKLQTEDPINAFVSSLSKVPISTKDAEALGVEPFDSFMSHATVGYELISQIKQRGHVKEHRDHAFVEPVVTLGQYVSLRDDRFDVDDFILHAGWSGQSFLIDHLEHEHPGQ